MPPNPIKNPFGPVAPYSPRPELNWENEWIKSRGDVYELQLKLANATRMLDENKLSSTERDTLEQLQHFLRCAGCTDLQQYADHVIKKSSELKGLNAGLAADLEATTNAHRAEICQLKQQNAEHEQALQTNIDSLTAAKDELHERARQELGEIEERAAKLKQSLDEQVLQVEVLKDLNNKSEAASVDAQKVADAKQAALERELEIATTTLAEQSLEIRDLALELEDSESMRQILEDQVRAHKTEIAELGNQVESALGLAKELEQGFNQQSKHLTLTLEAKSEELAILQASHAQVSQSIEAQAHTIETKKVQIAKQSNMISMLKQRIATNKEEVEQLNGKLAETTNERDQLRATIVEQAQALEEQANTKQELEATIAQIQAELSHVLSQNESNENTARIEIGGYESRVNDLGNTIQNLKRGAELLRGERDANAKQIVKLSHDLSESKQRILHQATEFNQANNDIRASHAAEVMLLKAQIEELRLMGGSLEEQQDRNMELQTQLANIEGLVKAQEETIKERENGLYQRDAEIDHLKIRIDTYANLEVLEKDHVRQNEALRERLNAVESTKNDVEACLFAESKLRRQLQERLLDIKGTIRVFCRVRPPKTGETCHDGSFILDEYQQQVTLNQIVNGNRQRHTFQFDQVFGRYSTNADIFAEVDLLVQSCFNGFNACIFAYGQTGSGKTYTMLSDDGIVYRSMRTLFELKATVYNSAEVKICASFVEIYNEKVRDLIGNQEGREPALVECGDYNALCNLLRRGHNRRTVASTAMNDQSSRSHSIFCIVVNSTDRKTGITTQGKVNLIDLAGSERPKRSLVVGQQLQEAKAINTSLTVLGNVIQALATNQKHVPFRSSKLTFALQDSLQGKCKTLMLVNLSPSLASLGESLTSLRFAEKVNSVKLARNSR